MDQESHWNTIAPSYEDEIFDVFKSDKKRKLPEYFRKHADKNHLAIDFGCGVGKAFSFLAPAFGNVLATDISAECLSIAKKNTYKNITYKRADLTSRNLKFPLADFAFCCNVIMLPEIEMNVRMIQNIQKALKVNGTALIVIPSMESMMFAAWRLIDWYKKEGVTPNKIPGSELNYFKGSKIDILQGLVHINGVPTKHYSEQEIQVLFNDAKLSITAIERLEYDWNTEFASPPDWMQEPYPWDWLVECKKIG